MVCDDIPGTLRPPSFALSVPEGDDHERLICTTCGFIRYDNPKIIVGAVCTWESKVLLVRRAIEPRVGYWCMPAGFMELNETTEAGAAREVWEEARARVRIGPLLALYNLPHISQVHLIYSATMLSPDHAPGSESLETCLVGWGEIPWGDLAYPTVEWALRQHAERGGLAGAPYGNRAETYALP
ncbi:NUDIX hydrolase [Rhodospirillum rubrum]|uniref:NUDIX hydrolase n=1 Tax=Rhodospirillum rubrum TaxID=1085 RepID=UPI001905C1AE|nr:NUDIX domain-containing protein [Rhodospirillum rubrum]MBK1666011.1 NUDIX hydrolase [Rhodospirillum rubrum]MBK1678132.1 NUDIX hydrolase [Rhodospirillum rubrum]